MQAALDAIPESATAQTICWTLQSVQEQAERALRIALGLPEIAGDEPTKPKLLPHRWKMPTPESRAPGMVEDGGMRVGEIIGYRVWRIDHRGYLHSGYMDTLWLPGVPMTGKPGDGEGIHAFKEQGRELHDAAIEYQTGYNVATDEDNRAYQGAAVGTVALWGDVLESERGWTAQYAMVDSIISVQGPNITHHRKLLQGLRWCYVEEPALRRKASDNGPQ